MHLHMPPRSELLLYIVTVPIMIVSIIISVLNFISLVLTYQIPG
jgi:hypothetical protein